MKNRSANYIKIMVLFLSLFIIQFCQVSCDEDDSPESDPRVHGLLTDESGSGISGVRVILHDRETNEKFEGRTNEEGKYSIPLDFGSYNIGFFSDDYITFYHGPVVINDKGYKLDKMLQSSSEVVNTTVFGHVLLEDKSPATGYMIYSESFTNDSTESRWVYGNTDENGYFNLEVIGQIHFDLVIFDDRNWQKDRFPLMKLDQACEVDIILDENHRNHFEHDAGAAPTPPNPAGPFPEYTTENIPFSWFRNEEDRFIFPDPEYPYGQLGTQGKVMNYYLTGHDTTQKTDFNIWIARDGNWLDPYALHVIGHPETIEGLEAHFSGTFYAQTRFGEEFTGDCTQAYINEPILYIPGVGSRKTSFGYTQNSGTCGNGTPPDIYDSSGENDYWVTITMIIMIPREQD